MRRSGRILLIAAAAWAAPAALPARSTVAGARCPAQSTTGAQRRQIRHVLETWREAYNRGDWPRTMDLVAPDQIGWTAQGTTIDYDSQANRARQRAAAKARPTGRYTLSVKEIVVCGDMALVRDVWTFAPVSGDPTAGTAVRSFELFRRQPNGSWKISRWMDAPAADQAK